MGGSAAECLQPFSDCGRRNAGAYENETMHVGSGGGQPALMRCGHDKLFSGLLPAAAATTSELSFLCCAQTWTDMGEECTLGYDKCGRLSPSKIERLLH